MQHTFLIFYHIYKRFHHTFPVFHYLFEIFHYYLKQFDHWIKEFVDEKMTCYIKSIITKRGRGKIRPKNQNNYGEKITRKLNKAYKCLWCDFFWRSHTSNQMLEFDSQSHKWKKFRLFMLLSHIKTTNSSIWNGKMRLFEAFHLIDWTILVVIL